MTVCVPPLPITAASDPPCTQTSIAGARALPNPRVLSASPPGAELILGKLHSQIRFLWGFSTSHLQLKHIIFIIMFNYTILEGAVIISISL